MTTFTNHVSATKKTKVLIHGFINNGRSPWVVQAKNELLKKASLIKNPQKMVCIVHAGFKRYRMYMYQYILWNGMFYHENCKALKAGYMVSVVQMQHFFTLKCNVFNFQGDFNVIVVDWGSGAKWPYEQAAGNGFLVGAEVAALITYLRDHAHIKLSDVHIIGHSLGAQVAGLAGHSLTKIGRITGLREDIPHFLHGFVSLML